LKSFLQSVEEKTFPTRIGTLAAFSHYESSLYVTKFPTSKSSAPSDSNQDCTAASPTHLLSSTPSSLHFGIAMHIQMIHYDNVPFAQHRAQDRFHLFQKPLTVHRTDKRLRCNDSVVP
jgi:hypothetical protein